MTIFAMSVFDATVIYDGKELFKGQGAATGWAEKLAKEIESRVTVEKIGTGWALVGRVDGVDCRWGIMGQRPSGWTDRHAQFERRSRLFHGNGPHMPGVSPACGAVHVQDSCKCCASRRRQCARVVAK